MSSDEARAHSTIRRLFAHNPVAEHDRLDNLALFVRRQMWCRYLFMHHIYQLALPVHGSIMEFGCRWGQNLALFSAFRGIHEPFNHNRKIIGFDTFTGFPSVGELDGGARRGDYGTSENYLSALQEILAWHELQSPVSHIDKIELVPGDVIETLPRYLERHPETVIALAYFDLDLYAPTSDALGRILPYLVKGSVIGFDELNHAPFPGETVAVKNVFGLRNIRLQRLPFSPTTSFMIYEGE